MYNTVVRTLRFLFAADHESSLPFIAHDDDWNRVRGGSDGAFAFLLTAVGCFSALSVNRIRQRAKTCSLSRRKEVYPYLYGLNLRVWRPVSVRSRPFFSFTLFLILSLPVNHLPLLFSTVFLLHRPSSPLLLLPLMSPFLFVLVHIPPFLLNNWIFEFNDFVPLTLSEAFFLRSMLDFIKFKASRDRWLATTEDVIGASFA